MSYSVDSAIIVLNWNQEALTRSCLESLLRINGRRHRILLVDNGSNEKIFQQLHSEFHDKVDFIRNETNLGFSQGNNRGIQEVLGIPGIRYICLLNNDTTVDPDFLTPLVETANSDPSIGIVGGKIYYAEPTGRIWQKGGNLNMRTGEITMVQQEQALIYDVDYVSGCLMLIKTSVIRQIGVLEPLFFNYFEDTDFCFRAKENGYRVVVDSRSVIYHKVSATVTPAWKQYEYFRNLPLFFALRKQFHPGFLFHYPWRFLSKFFTLLFSKDRTGFRTSWLGFRDFLIGRFNQGSINRVRKW